MSLSIIIFVLIIIGQFELIITVPLQNNSEAVIQSPEAPQQHFDRWASKVSVGIEQKNRSINCSQKLYDSRYSNSNRAFDGDYDISNTTAQLFANIKFVDMLERDVPPSVSRFDYPWCIPRRRWTTLSLKESRYRVLYSPVRDKSGAGLGHAMATLNADISTAFRLNLTYTHRIPMCGSLTSPLKEPYQEDNLTHEFQHAGAVEQLLGWGVGEIPREHIQAAVDPSLITETNWFSCRKISNTQLSIHKRKTRRHGKTTSTCGHFRFALRVDRVVEIPAELSYFYPHYPSSSDEDRVRKFIRWHSKPFSVFTMPSEYCDKIPAYGVETPQQRSFFFHKYWDAHGHDAPKVKRKEEWQRESFVEYRTRITDAARFAHVGRRPQLTRMREDAVNIAIHARRGDFFDVKRPMLSMATLASVVRQVVGRVINIEKGIFSKMRVSITIYAEGMMRFSNRSLSDHDVSEMGHDFVDVDGQVLNETRVTAMLTSPDLSDQTTSETEDVFPNGVRVSLRVSENTILCVHEMIAADVFIGSESGLSTHVIGSTSRAAFLMMPGKNFRNNARFARFDKNTGVVARKELNKMRYWWSRFQKKNEASAQNARLRV